jgi:chromosome segregation ATPase
VSLLGQVQALDRRMKGLLTEKDSALAQYEAKVNGQEVTRTNYQGKLEDIKRLIASQDLQNKDLYDKLTALKAKIGDAEQEYPQLREQLSDVMKSNRGIKQELGLCQSALRHENDLD